MKPLLVLVHSPLIGPASWQAVAALLSDRGERVAVPDLTPALNAAPPCVERQVVAVRRSIGGERAILIGHSGAGPLLPALGVGGRWVGRAAARREGAPPLHAGLPVTSAGHVR